ncbi:MAG TPA: GTPase domain-containing protein [Polyangiaceae bacterium]
MGVQQERRVQLNFAGREITIKLVYYGPALSGKTTNLKALHELTSDDSHGRLMTLETRDDRTLFFDMLPLLFRAGDAPRKPGDRSYTPVDPTMGMSLRIKVFTVPGQVLHGATRRLVLQGADGVAFIADSQVAETENNAASFLDLRSNLKELNVSVKDMPIVIQFNKRDLPNIRTDEEIKQLAQQGREPVFRASALSGEGVVETFFGLLSLTWSKLESEHQLSRIIGIEPREFVPVAARKMGIKRDVSAILASCLGGNLDFRGAEKAQ